MDLRSLRYFLSVAEELHFARAAERLEISPPTVTVQIKRLEQRLGTPLFVRQSGSVKLTAAGLRLKQEAAQILQQTQRAEQSVREAGRGQTGTISIGFLNMLTLTGLLPAVLAQFSNDNPDIAYTLVRSDTFLIMENVISGKLDVGFARRTRHYPPELIGFTIAELPLVVAIPKGHRLAKLKRIGPEDLAGEVLYSNRFEVELAFWGTLVNAIPPSPRIELRPRTNDIVSLLVLVSAGMGLGIVPAAYERHGMPNIEYRPLKGKRKFIELCAMYRRKESAPHILRFIDVLRKWPKNDLEGSS
jgi:DNA-binding transcriptional LysR family regulator